MDDRGWRDIFLIWIRDEGVCFVVFYSKHCSLVVDGRVSVMDLADQDGLDVSLNCEIKLVSEFSGFDEALTAK